MKSGQQISHTPASGHMIKKTAPYLASYIIYSADVMTSVTFPSYQQAELSGHFRIFSLFTGSFLALPLSLFSLFFNWGENSNLELKSAVEHEYHDGQNAGFKPNLENRTLFKYWGARSYNNTEICDSQRDFYYQSLW